MLFHNNSFFRIVLLFFMLNPATQHRFNNFLEAARFTGLEYLQGSRKPRPSTLKPKPYDPHKLYKPYKRCGLDGSQGVDHVPVPGAACPALLVDLTSKGGQHLALQWLSSPHLVGVFLTPPRGICSRARGIPLVDGHPGPNPLRSLRRSDLVCVNKANQLYQFLVTVCAAACDRCLLMAVENPRSSLFWHTSFCLAAHHCCPVSALCVWWP